MTRRGLIVDLFAGGGGASTGLLRATGRHPDIAINHNPSAIAMHEANHPQTKHMCASVWEVDPREVCGRRPVELLWASPDCRHFSRAKGAAPVSPRVRSLAHVIVEWGRALKPKQRARIILMENVPEFETWGPLLDSGRPCPARKGESFQAFVSQLEWLGYRVEWRSLVAADYGAPTTRKRLFLVARRDGMPIVWPEPTHGPGRARPWRPAAEIIDWALPCPSIFERARPLAEATQRRIATGLRRFVIDAAEPFVVTMRGTSQGHLDTSAASVYAPLRTVSAGGSHHAIVVPSLVEYYGTGGAREVDSPLRTATTHGRFALVAPTLIQTGYGERDGQAPRVLDLAMPLGTVVAGGAKHGLVVAWMSKHYGGVVGHQLDRPLGTVTTVDHHALTTATLHPGPQDRRNEVADFLARHCGRGDPLLEEVYRHFARDIRIGGARYEIADIGMRMLSPRELFRAQGFPESYDLLDGQLTKTEQIALAGNSVCPDVAAALAAANLAVSAPSRPPRPRAVFELAGGAA